MTNIKRITLQNNLKKEIGLTRREIENKLDIKGYESKVYADYKLEIIESEIYSKIELKVYIFKNAGEDNEEIQQLEITIDTTSLVDLGEVVGKIESKI